MVKYARRIAALSNNLRSALKDEKERIRSLTVGITHTAESSAIVEALAAYISSCGDLNVKIITNTADQLYAAVKNFELDFAFVEGKGGGASLRYLMLDTDCLVLAVPPDHALARRSMITIDELKKEKLILRLPHSNTRDLFNAAVESQGLHMEDFNVLMEIDSIATIKDLIRQGFGVSVLAKSVCMNEMKKGKLAVLTIENMSMMREINIAYRQDFPHPELLHGIVKQYNEMQKK